MKTEHGVGEGEKDKPKQGASIPPSSAPASKTVTPSSNKAAVPPNMTPFMEATEVIGHAIPTHISHQPQIRHPPPPHMMYPPPMMNIPPPPINPYMQPHFPIPHPAMMKRPLAGEQRPPGEPPVKKVHPIDNLPAAVKRKEGVAPTKPGLVAEFMSDLSPALKQSLFGSDANATKSSRMTEDQEKCLTLASGLNESSKTLQNIVTSRHNANAQVTLKT